MGRLETIRGLERGLLVLQALQTNPIASLHEIHLATRISNPRLLRILNTLERAGYVARRLVDGHYRISSFARVGRKRDRYDRVAEAAAPVLDRLCHGRPHGAARNQPALQSIFCSSVVSGSSGS